MIAPNLMPDVILGVNFLKENNVVIDLTEGRVKARKGGSDCEHGFFYGSLPKNKFEVGFISNSEIQPNISVLRRQLGEKGIVVGTRTIHALIPTQQSSQKELLSVSDNIKADEVGYYARDGETSVSINESWRDETVADESFTRDDNRYEFIVNMLCSNEMSSEEQLTETKLSGIRGHLQTQEADLRPHLEANDIRALSVCDLHK
jgi:hypothetical protein